MRDVEQLAEAFAYVDGLAGGLVVHRRDAPRLVAERFGIPAVAAEGLLVLWEATLAHKNALGVGASPRERAVEAIIQNGGLAL
jgi:hypothetical protein